MGSGNEIVDPQALSILPRMLDKRPETYIEHAQEEQHGSGVGKGYDFQPRIILTF